LVRGAAATTALRPRRLVRWIQGFMMENEERRYG
jgi:hypothetical protein